MTSHPPPSALEAAEAFRHSDGVTEGCKECFLAGATWAIKSSPEVRGLLELLEQAIDGNTRLVVPGHTWNERVKRTLAAWAKAGAE